MPHAYPRRSVLPRPLVAVLCLLIASLVVTSLTSCKTSPIRWEALAPASQADLDTLAADVAGDRENLRAGLDAVAKDLEAANIAAAETRGIAAQVEQKANEVANRPASGGIPGALINTILGSGVLPGWADWLLSLIFGGAATGAVISKVRNRSRAKALADYDAQPFVDPVTGLAVSEGALVRRVVPLAPAATPPAAPAS